MMLTTSLRLLARLLKRSAPASSTASADAPVASSVSAPITVSGTAPSERPDLSHRAAHVPRQTLETQALEQRIAELSMALARSTRRADAADQLARQTAELSASGARVFDETMATFGRTKVEVRSLAELLTLIDSITTRMQSLAWHAGAEAAWAGEQDAALAKLAGDARRLAEEGAGTAQAARRHVNASVGQVETGVARAAEVATTFSDVARSLEQVRHTLAIRTDARVP
ncbi:MAG: methyl-accepting chemotaxis protein, partial [Janthinobacterium lividum]